MPVRPLPTQSYRQPDSFESFGLYLSRVRRPPDMQIHLHLVSLHSLKAGLAGTPCLLVIYMEKMELCLDLRVILAQGPCSPSLSIQFYRILSGDTDYKMQEYLRFQTNRARRSLPARSRTGSHWLQTQVGRFRRVNREDRNCSHCDMHEV